MRRRLKHSCRPGAVMSLCHFCFVPYEQTAAGIGIQTPHGSPARSNPPSLLCFCRLRVRRARLICSQKMKKKVLPLSCSPAVRPRSPLSFINVPAECRTRPFLPFRDPFVVDMAAADVPSSHASPHSVVSPQPGEDWEARHLPPLSN